MGILASRRLRAIPPWSRPRAHPPVAYSTRLAHRVRLQPGRRRLIRPWTPDSPLIVARRKAGIVQLWPAAQDAPRNARDGSGEGGSRVAAGGEIAALA